MHSFSIANHSVLSRKGYYRCIQQHTFNCPMRPPRLVLLSPPANPICTRHFIQSNGANLQSQRSGWRYNLLQRIQRMTDKHPRQRKTLIVQMQYGSKSGQGSDKKDIQSNQALLQQVQRRQKCCSKRIATPVISAQPQGRLDLKAKHNFFDALRHQPTVAPGTTTSRA